jgi:hypothetical protein
MAVTGHPPHRPVLAGTTAYGSYLGCDSFRRLASRAVPQMYTHGVSRARHDIAGAPVAPHRVGQVFNAMTFSLVPGLSSTTSAARVSTGFVRRLRRYYARVRLLASVHDRIVLLASRPDPPMFRWIPARSLGSRACSFSTCVRLLDYAGPDENSRLRFRQCGLPVVSTRSAPGTRFSKLDSSPVDASVYTSPGTSRHPAQDSRSRWFATPFLWGSFIPDCTPVYPDVCAPSRSRLCFRCSRFGGEFAVWGRVRVLRGKFVSLCYNRIGVNERG